MTSRTRKKNIEQIKADLEKLVKDGEQLLQEEKSNASSTAQEIQQQLAESLENARNFFTELGETTQNHLSEIDDSVHKSPYKYVGIACGIGVALGLLINKSND